MQEWHSTTWSKKKGHTSSRHVFGVEAYSSPALPQYGNNFENPILRINLERCEIRGAVSPFQTKYSRLLPIQLGNDKGRYRQLVF